MCSEQEQSSGSVYGSCVAWHHPGMPQKMNKRNNQVMQLQTDYYYYLFHHVLKIALDRIIGKYNRNKVDLLHQLVVQCMSLQ